MYSSGNALCDWSALDLHTEGQQPLVSVFRGVLKKANENLQLLFHRGEKAEDLVRQRAQLVDQVLIHAWNRFISAEKANIVLVAVGGYGRGELHPYSDIDLLILLESKCRDLYAERIRGFITFLWDIGLEIGQSVRSIRECVNEAKKDITVATNLMEARRLTGSQALFETLQKKVGPNKIWPSKKFFKAKIEEQNRRHHRFHDTAYNLEPNIKENPGGLRDLQVIGWVVKRHFNAQTLHELVDHDFLTVEEYEILKQSQEFLWRIRIGLHLAAGRREDRLLFDLQRTLAQEFGYQDSDHHLAVELFMKDYYRTVMELNRLNEMLLQLFDEVILSNSKRGKIKPINNRFQSRDGFLEVKNDRIFKRYPFALLEMFLIMAQHPKLRGVRAQTIRLVRNHHYLIDDNFRNDLRCHSLFMEIFRQPFGITHELRRMNRYGILAAYLPVFANAVGLMQHDLFHVYTVDEHTMFLIRNLRRFTVPRFANELPFCSKLIQSIPKQELLYLAGLFHDIAKGRGGNHSKLGAEDATSFCRHHGLSRYDTNLVAWLVEHHLLLSTTAQRKDISDPEIVTDFAHSVGSQERLNYLYLLTVADIRATNPNLWNSWKDSLLRELYFSTTIAFNRGLENPLQQSERIAETKTLAHTALCDNAVDSDWIMRFWSNLDDDYFIRYSSDEIIWHTNAIFRAAADHLPLVLIRDKTHRGGTELFVYTHDANYIFALITAVLGSLGLTVTDARIITSDDGYTLDSFIILEENGDTITNKHRLEEIKHKVAKALTVLTYENVKNNQPKRLVSRQLKQFPIRTQITFGTDTRNQHTIMEVVARDQPGLLARIAMALVECQCQLYKAKIATLGERAEDIFYIADQNNKPLSDVGQLNALRDKIIELLDT